MPGTAARGRSSCLAPDRHLGIAVLANMSSLEKAEIAQDTLAILLGGARAARPPRARLAPVHFHAGRRVWADYVGEYQTSEARFSVYPEGDQLLGAVAGLTIEFIPRQRHQFVMLSDVSTLDEEPVEFERRPDGSVVFVFFGHPFASRMRISSRTGGHSGTSPGITAQLRCATVGGE